MTGKTDKGSQAGKRRSGSLSARERKRLLIGVVLALCLGLGVGVLVTRHLLKPTPPAPPAQNATVEAPKPEALAERIARIDQVIHASLKAVKPDAPAPHTVAEPREHAGEPYNFQTLRLPPVDRQSLHAHLVKELAQAVPGAALTGAGEDTWNISLDGLPTHRLHFTAEAAPPEAPRKPAAAARVAIVIDDMGEDVAIAKDLAGLPAPVAFSIWPDSSRREAVLKIAKAAGREVLIHLPMQPHDYPKVNPGPHPLLVTMTPEEIKATVRRAVSRVPGAIGVNNHMGSQFTESSLGIRLALTALEHEGLFFLDSRTSAKTVGAAEAKHLGLRTYKRDVFLDNEQNPALVLEQLRKVEALALKRGHAIALGHPHKGTVLALRQWLKVKDPAVQVVPLSSLPPL